MIHEPNTNDWHIGDLVIHDFDRKVRRMLMQVVARKGEDFVTEYKYPEDIIPNALIRHYGSFDRVPSRIRTNYTQTYINRKEVLHDPARFGIRVGGL